jgi:hypothetical protein
MLATPATVAAMAASKKITKVVLVILASYVLIGFLLVANNRGFTKGVHRRIIPALCSKLGTPVEVLNNGCADTQEIRRKIFLNWPQWQLSSDYKGIDEAVYKPIDLILAAAAVAGAFIVLNKKQH